MKRGCAAERVGLWLGWALLLCLPLANVGCAIENSMRDDVVAIRQYYSQPWLKDDDGRVNGMRMRVYFISAETEKGVFVPGEIRTALEVLEPLPDGTYARELVHEWRFDQREAAGFRILRKSIIGDSYGFVLPWPAHADVAGREVQVQFEYTRHDGRVIARRGSRFCVPTPRVKIRPEASREGGAVWNERRRPPQKSDNQTNGQPAGQPDEGPK